MIPLLDDRLSLGWVGEGNAEPLAEASCTPD